MFSGEDVIDIHSTLPEAEFHEKVEEALRSLGRVRIGKRGELTIEPRNSLKSFLTEVTLEGTIREKRKDDYEVALFFDCSPSVVNWILTIVLFFTTCIGVVVVFAPLMEKGKIKKTIGRALDDLEDSVGSSGIQR
jgi:hypothetical protein